MYLLDDGKVSYANNKPDEVFQSIVGSKDSRISLQQFCDYPAEIARIRFITECLGCPDVIGFDTNNGRADPQIDLIADGIDEKSKPKVLEIGIGKARVLAALADQSNDIGSKVDYVGTDIGEDHRAECESVLSRIYGESTGRLHIGDATSLAQKIGESSFDFVLMCSVLHEIEPTDWIKKYFGKDGIVNYGLSNNGMLIVVEDYFLPHGERAHDFDYLVLDREALCKLFASSGEEIETKCSSLPDYTDRIKAHFIPKHLIKNADVSTQLAALESLRESSLSNAKKLRAKNQQESSKFKVGGRLAFFEHQYINAIIALEACKK